jgi:Lon protease-like protein
VAILEKDEELIEIPGTLPVLPLRDVVIFPGMITPLLVGRQKSLASLDDAMKNERLLLVITQRELYVEDPSTEDLYSTGTIVRILQIMRLVEGTMRILVEGLARGEVERWTGSKKLFRARVAVHTPKPSGAREMRALVRSVTNQFTEYVQRTGSPTGPADSDPDRRFRPARRLDHCAPYQDRGEAADPEQDTRPVRPSAGCWPRAEISNSRKKIESDVKTRSRRIRRTYLQEQPRPSARTR